ncbi:MAG: hypothetical protein B7X12_08740 [Halothiobacillus sp. 20-53-49]|nr:MAG: hypothetical protein B7X12_08740 [Halothiobacillus sp. 20-53-49]
MVIAAGLLFAAWRWLPLRKNWVGWLGAVLIGSVVGLAFGVTGGNLGQAAQAASEMANSPQEGLGTQSFTFSAPMGDVVYFLQHPTHFSDITFGVVAVFGLLLGSLISTAIRREFGLVLPTTVREWSRTIIGSVMVGGGSVLAMGCTVGHGLSGISTLALGSFVALGAIMVGAWLALRFTGVSVWHTQLSPCAAATNSCKMPHSCTHRPEAQAARRLSNWCSNFFRLASRSCTRVRCVSISASILPQSSLGASANCCSAAMSASGISSARQWRIKASCFTCAAP